MAEPGAQVLQRRKRVLDLDERRRSLALRPIFKQFGRPDRVGAAVSGSDNAAHDLAVEEEIIGARRELDEAIGHDGPLADLAWSSIHAWVIAMATITRTGSGREGLIYQKGQRRRKPISFVSGFHHCLPMHHPFDLLAASADRSRWIDCCFQFLWRNRERSTFAL